MTNCLLLMIQKMNEAGDKKVYNAVFTELSKVFVCLKHDALIAKWHAFCFDYKSLRGKCTYLNNSIQVTKVGSYYSEILDITFWVPQVEILGLLLFSINLFDLFFIEHYR